MTVRRASNVDYAVSHIVHTPLILYHPRQEKPGAREGALVQMLDLQPTILDCLGLPVPLEAHGRSLLPLVTGQGDTQARDIAIFGVFGGSVYATDGEWVFNKRAVPENAPLNWYTQSHFQQWEFGQINHLETSRERLPQFKEGRFPAWYAGDTLNHGGPNPRAVAPHAVAAARQHELADELYHVSTDYEQTQDLARECPDVVERFRSAVAGYLRQIEAPDEQLDRLALRPYV